jgi:hypothetical protein
VQEMRWDFSAAKGPDRKEVNETAAPNHYDNEADHRSEHDAQDQFVLHHGNALSTNGHSSFGVSDWQYGEEARAKRVGYLGLGRLLGAIGERAGRQWGGSGQGEAVWGRIGAGRARGFGHGRGVIKEKRPPPLSEREQTFFLNSQVTARGVSGRFQRPYVFC